MCHEKDQAARRWLRYFVSESHTEEGTRSRVRDAAGFCPAHTRYLLAHESHPWLMPQVHELALAGGRRLLGAKARPTRCPACGAGIDAAERALATVLRAFDHDDVRQAVTCEALCLPHLTLLATNCPPAQGRPLAQAAGDRLAHAPYGVDWLAGSDADAEARAGMLDQLEPLVMDEEQHPGSVAARWRRDLAVACCPLCLAQHRGVRRLLIWAVAAQGHGRPASEESILCARHLHDLAAVSGPNAEALFRANADAWRTRLVRFAGPPQDGTPAQGRAVALLLAAPPCRACEEERLCAVRQRALLTAQLLDDRQARAYARSHGICLHHALTWTGPLPDVVRSVLSGRMAVLGWEVDEALRKQDWRTRHEPRSDEVTVGRRAPTLLDGRVYGGLPPPPYTLQDSSALAPPTNGRKA